MYGYEIGTKVQQKNGVIRVKVGKSNWMPESRYNWVTQKGELKEGQRVFHLNGDVTDNHPRNLVPIQFNTKKFVVLKSSRVLYIPKSTQLIREITKKFESKELAKV